MPPSSNKRHLRDRTFCHQCLQERHVSPNCEIMDRGINICRVGGVANNVMEGKTMCNVFLTFRISVIHVLLQLQNGSIKFIKIFGISLADSNKTLPFKFCNRDHQRRRDKRNLKLRHLEPSIWIETYKIQKKNASVEFTQIQA